MTRRQMIRASAIAGAGAWTAPAIVDSLTSPATAGSASPISCSWFYVVYMKPDSSTVWWTSANNSSTVCNNAQPANNSGTRTKTCYHVTYTLPDAQGPIPTYDSGSGAVQATNDPNCSSYISINGTTLSAKGNATLLAAWSHPGSNSVCSACPSTSANNSVSVCGTSACDS
jgi:hypothetical protein